MRPIFQLVAERIEQDSSSPDLSAIRIFEQLAAPSFPHVKANLGVLVRFEMSAEEGGREVDANIGLVHESGHREHLDQRRRYLPVQHAGRPPFWNFGLNLASVRFEAPGQFALVIRIDKVIVAEIPFLVVAQDPPE